MKITALIVDDDKDSRLVLHHFVEAYFPDIIIAGEADSAATALAQIKKLSPDFLLLDISLPDGNAFDMLKKIPEKKFEIIFITAYDSYAIEAFRYAALDYLLKPVALKDLKEALNKITERVTDKYFSRHWNVMLHNMMQHGNYDRKLAVATGNGYVFVDIRQIERLESESNYTHFFLEDGTRLISSSTMGTYEELLPAEKFCRIHHSHIVNTDYVSRYSREGVGGTIIMKNGVTLGVAQRRKEAVLNRLTGKSG